MPRNSSGTYSLPIGAFSPGGLIKSSDMNSNFSDIGTALTQSLATTGVTTMTGPIPAASGAVSGPGYSFAGDLTTGFYRPASHQIAWAYGGTQGGILNNDSAGGAIFNAALTCGGLLTVSAGGANITGTLAVTGAVTVSTSLTVTQTSTLVGKASLSSTDSMALPNGTTGQRNGSPAAGDFRYNSTLAAVEYWNGTYWVTPTFALPGAQAVTIKNNSGTPNTKADVTVAGVAVLINANGFSISVNAPGLITANFGTTGAGGMDTGGLPTSAPLYIYGIYNAGTATWSVVGSTAAPSTGPLLPSGYTFSVYLGDMMCDGSAHLLRTSQTGKRVQYTSSAPNIGSGTITYATFFPSNSEAGLVQGFTTGTTGSTFSISDMSSINVGELIQYGTSSGITLIGIVQNTGGTTFTTSATTATINAYGWISRANVT